MNYHSLPQTYLKLEVPIYQGAQWFVQLRQALAEAGFNTRWQDGHFHITVVFLNDDKNVDQLTHVFGQCLKNSVAPTITLDKLGAFMTSNNQIIVNITSSKPSKELMSLIDELRESARQVDANMDNRDFRLHITLGRIKVPSVYLKDVQTILSGIEIPAFTLKLDNAEYRYRGPKSIRKWKIEEKS